MRAFASELAKTDEKPFSKCSDTIMIAPPAIAEVLQSSSSRGQGRATGGALLHHIPVLFVLFGPDPLRLLASRLVSDAGEA